MHLACFRSLASTRPAAVNVHTHSDSTHAMGESPVVKALSLEVTTRYAPVSVGRGSCLSTVLLGHGCPTLCTHSALHESTQLAHSFANSLSLSLAVCPPFPSTRPAPEVSTSGLLAVLLLCSLPSSEHGGHCTHGMG